MKFGVRYCNTARYTKPENAVELVQAAEAAGFESAWTVDHVVVPEGYESQYPYTDDGKMAGGKNDIPLPDPLIWMTYVAARTERIKFGTGILIVPQRNPVVTAKQVATLDYMSGGRVLLGIGVGWMEEEFRALNAPFKARGRATDEYIGAMRELWSAEKPNFHGEFINFDGAHCQPQPPNKSVPIIVGGHSKAAARRAGRLGDGFFPARGVPTDLFDLAKRTAEENGRDPDAIEFTVSMPEDLDELPNLAKAGVDRVLLPIIPMFGLKSTSASGPGDLARWSEIIDKYRDA
jgi:probable F420-dependent oxidoreductase